MLDPPPLTFIFGAAALLMAVSFVFRWSGGSLHAMNYTLLDGWSLAHVLLYSIASFYHPNKKELIFTLGFLWEASEYICEERGVPNVVFKPIDLLYNLLGIFIGSAVRRHCDDCKRSS